MAKQIVDVVYKVMECEDFELLYVEWVDYEEGSGGFGTVKKYKDKVHGKYGKIKEDDFSDDCGAYEGDD